MENEHRNGIESVPEIRITTQNLGRLDALLADHSPIRSWRAVEFLVRELMRANIVDDHEIPPRVATMRSQVKFREGDNRFPTVATLVYPGDSGLYDDALSILTPVGAALLGLSEGQSMRYPGPDGKLKKITLMKVLHQPEAARQVKPG